MSNHAEPIAVTLQEWTTCGADQFPLLRNYHLPESEEIKKKVEALERNGIVQIRDLHHRGVEISALSFVGRLVIDRLHITIVPKIDTFNFLKLLQYTYGLRDLSLQDSSSFEGRSDTFHEVLAYQLLLESSEIMKRGLRRQYTRKHEDLSVPRGRINFREQTFQQSKLTTTLPCEHHPRLVDCLHNRTLLAGLQHAARIVNDTVLRGRLNRQASIMSEYVEEVPLSRALLQETERHASRLTRHYEPAVHIIQMLKQFESISLDNHGETVLVSGFVFDMNLFFQRLISRYLTENLDRHTIKDEHVLRGFMQYDPDFNPKNKSDLNPRPDFAICCEGRVVTLLDAKYRDLWMRELPREMLYQLAIYAMSGLGDGNATILYPTVDNEASESRITINPPSTGEHKWQVILRPVNMMKLVSLTGKSRTEEAMRYAKSLALGQSVVGLS